MYCRNCGKELPDGSKFCNHCGGSQQSEVVSTSQTHDEPEDETLFRSTKSMREAVKKNRNNSEKKKPGCFSIGISLIFLFIVAVCVMASMDEAKEENSNSNSNSVVESTTAAPIEILASKLVQAYIDNEVKADMTYDDKTVIITGYVDRIEQTDSLFSESEPVVYVGTGDSLESCLRCYLSAEQKSLVAELEQGDKITVVGRCAGLGSAYFKLKCVNIYDGVISK